MEDTLLTLLQSAQNGNKESVLKIIIKFTPLIKKYSKKLNYDGSDTDLIIELIEVINKIPIEEKMYIEKEECIVGYIHSSIKNKYIYLSKKYGKISKMETEFNIDIAKDESIDYSSFIEDQIILSELLDKLPSMQREILIGIFIKDYSVTQMAKKLGISRQAVNKAKNKALKKLKEELVGGEIWKAK